MLALPFTAPQGCQQNGTPSNNRSSTTSGLCPLSGGTQVLLPPPWFVAPSPCCRFSGDERDPQINLWKSLKINLAGSWLGSVIGTPGTSQLGLSSVWAVVTLCIILHHCTPSLIPHLSSTFLNPYCNPTPALSSAFLKPTLHPPPRPAEPSTPVPVSEHLRGDRDADGIKYDYV